jgi:hypothetical protein
MYARGMSTREIQGHLEEIATLCLATAISEERARQESFWFHDGIWWEYEVFNGQILSAVPRWDIWVRRGVGGFRTAK